jgi:hypothetical protein
MRLLVLVLLERLARFDPVRCGTRYSNSDVDAGGTRLLLFSAGACSQSSPQLADSVSRDPR